jgi:hypothetical protein
MKNITDLNFKDVPLAFLSGSDAYYIAAALIVQESEEIRSAAKTPSLYLRTEQKSSQWRDRYVIEAKPRIFEGTLSFKYVASWPNTKKEFDDMHEREPELATDSIHQLEDLLKLPNFKLRFANHDQFTAAFIGDNHTAIPWKGFSGKSEGALIIPTKDSPYNEWFDDMFEKASLFTLDKVKELKS